MQDILAALVFFISKEGHPDQNKIVLTTCCSFANAYLKPVFVIL